MNTLYLDQNSWDLTLDVNRNIALATNPYSQAQDAASAIKLFQGEAYYDTTIGIPYWLRILGQLPPITYIKAQFVAATLSVPGVTAAVVFLSSFRDRIFSGQVQITTDPNAPPVVANF